jgi:hypothetical protein
MREDRDLSQLGGIPPQLSPCVIQCPGSLQYRLGQEYPQIRYGLAGVHTALGELELGLPPNGGKEPNEPRPRTKRSFMDVGRHIPLRIPISYLSQRRRDGFKPTNDPYAAPPFDR